MRRILRTLAALSALALLLGNSNCSKNDSSDAPQFVTSIALQDSSGQPTTVFAKGDTVQFVITIRNRTAQAQTLFFNSDELLNLAVVDAGSASVVWTCDNDTTTACLIGSNLGTPSTSGSGFNEIDFKAFETKTVTVTWNQTDDSGAQVPARGSITDAGNTTGKYEVLGGFTVYNTTGPGDAADNGSSMAQGAPTAAQMFPSVYRSVLTPFTIQ
jgi:hypothetical protein